MQQELGKMRGKQRRLQKEIEAKLGPDKCQDETSYCKKCKLAFRQTVEEHEESKLHKDIAEFVDPMCALCGMNFFSPMAYAKHRASLGHLKVG